MNDLFEYLEAWFQEGIEIDPDVDADIVSGKTYKITVSDKVYHIDYVVGLTQSKDRIFEFKFRLMNNPKLPKKSEFKTDQQYQIAVQKSQVGITGTGDAKKVFNAVVSVIVKIIREELPEYITFQADEDNRKRLYKFIINDVIKKIGGYISINKHPVNNVDIEDGEFWLKKI